MTLAPHHLHREPDPHGIIEELDAPFNHMRDLQQGALTKLNRLILAAHLTPGAGEIHDHSCDAYDVVSEIKIERPLE